MNHRDNESATAGTAAPSGQTSGLEQRNGSTFPTRLQLTDEDRARDLASRRWSLQLLQRIIDAADASAESYRSRL